MTCDVCKAECQPDGFAAGYACTPDGKRLCYQCAGEWEKGEMVRKGKMALYDSGAEVVNWPGTLRFPVKYRSHRPHNMARWQYHLWFTGPDGHLWHGVRYGDNTQVVHCRRTKAAV